MRIKLIFTGSNPIKYLNEGIEEYLSRLKKYVKIEVFETKDLKNSKNFDINKIKKTEEQLIEKFINSSDDIYLMDEKGQQFSSITFSEFIQKQQVKSVKTLVLVIGGPYGFTDELKQKSKGLISFSKMTFTHQMIRLILVEQIYRAYTIINNEPYHHN